MLVHEFRSYANGVLVFLFFYVFNTMTNDLSVLENLGKATVITAIILISLTLLLGPLSRFFPKQFRHDLVYRKPLGLSGYFFVLAYGVINFSILTRELLPTVFWTIALIILSFQAAGVSPRAIKLMGFEKWKKLQIVGYIALAFMVLSFVSIGGGSFLKTTIGKSVLTLALITIGMKVLVITLGKKKKHSKFEINHLTKI